MKKIISLILLFSSLQLHSQVWVPDNGDGTYKNPIIYADYSDPDVIRVGDDYYMVASSFTCQPGIPVLHSKDLVNWTIINHVYASLPLERYKKVQHGQGSWAPSIRFHNGKYYVYFCTPEDGLFVATTSNPALPWNLSLVQNINNWEDPCPFWDADGQAYLLHGRVGAGPAILHKMSADGQKILDDGKIIYYDTTKQPTLEGFKFMDKKDGYYYFAAPAGGVSRGWQTVFRSKNIYGPYEEKIVIHQGSTTVNGPHQGGYVETQTGEWWFIHFQDKDSYGRIAHLQPVTWKDGWPITGVDKTNSGIGEPVLSYKKPNVGKTYPVAVPQTSDEFNSTNLGLQWQWQAAPNKNWYSLTTKNGSIRLYAVSSPTDYGSLFFAPNSLLQKFMAPSFIVTTKLNFVGGSTGDRTGLAIVGNYYSSICLEKTVTGNRIVLYEGKQRNQNRFYLPVELASLETNISTIWFRVKVNEDTTCSYSYSLDGNEFKSIGTKYKTEKGGWIGAKVGIFCVSPSINKSMGYADFDFFHVEK